MAASILLIGSDGRAADEIRAALEPSGHTLTVVGPDVDPAEVLDFPLALIDASASAGGVPEICRRLRAEPDLSAVGILGISQAEGMDERIAILEAGADDVITRPFEARELEARVEALLVRFTGGAPSAADRGPGRLHSGRRLITCFSPKGGVGTTTIAVNIALLAARAWPGKVLLIDLDLQFGQVATHLNLQDTHSLADVARDDDAQRDADVLRAYVTTTADGLAVLTAPPSPELAQRISRHVLERLIGTARGAWDIIVIDAGSSLDERMLAVIDSTDALVLPVVPELGALKALSELTSYLGDTGTVMERAVFVLNQLFARPRLSRKEIEEAIGSEIAAELPHDPVAYLEAINNGVPLLTSAPTSVAAARMSELAALALGSRVSGARPQPSRRSRLATVLRRA